MADEANVAWQRARLAEAAGRVDSLVQSDELKSALLASISHDLRSPLTSIKASVSSLRDPGVTWSPDDTGRFLEEIETQTDRLTRTVTNLLTLDRLKAGVVRPHFEPVEAAALIDEVLAACHEATCGRTVSVDVEDGLWLRTDYAMAVQAIVNLVNNAALHSTGDGTISIHASRLGPGVAIRICDDGPGIAAGILPRVFERYFQGGDVGDGAGLGLAIVHAMASLCDGTVAVRSGPHESAFTLTLPAAKAPP